MTLDVAVHRLDLLNGLLPEPRTKALATIAQLEAEGIVLRVTQGFRTSAAQAAIVAAHGSGSGVAAPVGFSWHEYRRAWDFCVIAFPGKATPASEVYDSAAPWDRIGEVGEAQGLEWGGRWKHADRDHFDDPGGMTIAQARAAGVPDESETLA